MTRKEQLKELIKLGKKIKNFDIDTLMNVYRDDFDGDFDEIDGEYYLWSDDEDDEGNIVEGYNYFVDDFCTIAEECGLCFSDKLIENHCWKLSSEEEKYCSDVQKEIEKKFNINLSKDGSGLRISSCSKNLALTFKEIGLSPKDCLKFIYINESQIHRSVNGYNWLGANYFSCCPFNENKRPMDKILSFLLSKENKSENKI